ETATEGGESVKSENDKPQNEELATKSLPDINPADEDQVTYDTPVSQEQTTPNETTSTKDIVEDIKPSMPTPEIEKVITKEDPIQVPGGTESCVVEVDQKVNDETTETKANIKPKVHQKNF
uniref:Uncharacterized protein n=1 Tax=Ciona savignyi TaxID=51511 RepID=H2YXK1_CIOSA